MADLLVAKDSFSHESAGYPETVNAGDIVEKGSPILKGREHLFEPLKIRFPAPKKKERGVEQATARPGEKRQRSEKAA